MALPFEFNHPWAKLVKNTFEGDFLAQTVIDSLLEPLLETPGSTWYNNNPCS